MHTHTQAPTHMSILKMGSKLRPETDEDSSIVRKHGYSFGNKNVLRFDLNESREGFCWRGRGRSFHVKGLKTEKAWEPTAESLV